VKCNTRKQINLFSSATLPYWSLKSSNRGAFFHAWSHHGISKISQEDATSSGSFGHFLIRIVFQPNNECRYSPDIKHVEKQTHWPAIGLPPRSICCCQVIHIVHTTFVGVVVQNGIWLVVWTTDWQSWCKVERSKTASLVWERMRRGWVDHDIQTRMSVLLFYDWLSSSLEHVAYCYAVCRRTSYRQKATLLLVQWKKRSYHQHLFFHSCAKVLLEFWPLWLLVRSLFLHSSAAFQKFPVFVIQEKYLSPVNQFTLVIQKTSSHPVHMA